jgi:hypothetical protein
MTRPWAAVAVLAALLLAGVLGVFFVWDAAASGEVAWAGREPGEAALMSFALWQLACGVGAPGFATLAATAAFALVVIGARAIAIRWTERGEAGRGGWPADEVVGSERRADDERVRLDMEVRRDE